MARALYIPGAGAGRKAWIATAVFSALLGGGVRLAGAQAVPAGQEADAPAEMGGAVPAGQGGQSNRGDQGEVLDRVVAVVNGELVLESDVEEEKRFAVFQPLRNPNEEFSRREAIERLINRTLILQQLKLQPQPAVTDKELDAEIAQLRKDLPECKTYHCETEAGWNKLVADQGFTMEEFRERWKRRMEVLRFIEQRFRMGIRISPEEIKTYYSKTLLPQYATRKATPPKLDDVSERIQEVLLQQQVSSLLGDWLKSLRAQGTVRILGQGQGQGQGPGPGQAQGQTSGTAPGKGVTP